MLAILWKLRCVRACVRFLSLARALRVLCAVGSDDEFRHTIVCVCVCVRAFSHTLAGRAFAHINQKIPNRLRVVAAVVVFGPRRHRFFLVLLCAFALEIRSATRAQARSSFGGADGGGDDGAALFRIIARACACACASACANSGPKSRRSTHSRTHNSTEMISRERARTHAQHSSQYINSLTTHTKKTDNFTSIAQRSTTRLSGSSSRVVELLLLMCLAWCGFLLG